MDNSDIPGYHNFVFPGYEQDTSFRLSSDLRRPAGSFAEEIMADGKALQIRSLGQHNLATLPEARLNAIKTVHTSRVHCSTTRTLVGQTQIESQSSAIGNSDGLVVETKTT